MLARLVKKYKKQSLVTYFLALLILVCAVAITVTNVIQMVQGHTNMSFSGICP